MSSIFKHIDVAVTYGYIWPEFIELVSKLPERGATLQGFGGGGEIEAAYAFHEAAEAVNDALDVAASEPEGLPGVFLYEKSTEMAQGILDVILEGEDGPLRGRVFKKAQEVIRLWREAV